MTEYDLIDDTTCPECGFVDCECYVAACRACGGSGHIYADDATDDTWECARCGGSGVDPEPPP